LLLAFLNTIANVLGVSIFDYQIHCKENLNSRRAKIISFLKHAFLPLCKSTILNCQQTKKEFSLPIKKYRWLLKISGGFAHKPETRSITT